MALPNMGGMERSLAFTALLEAKRAGFTQQEVETGPEAVTELLEAYSEFMDKHGNTVIAGVTDLWSFAQGYVRQVYGYES